MIDQCKNCLVRGEYTRCLEARCMHRETWIHKTLLARIVQLEEVLQIIANLPDVRSDECCNYASNALAILPPEVK